jgi:hypothetical protein
MARHLRTGRDRIGVTEISREANLTEAMTHRALRTLQERGWLMGVPAGGKGTTYTALTPLRGDGAEKAGPDRHAGGAVQASA